MRATPLRGVGSAVSLIGVFDAESDPFLASASHKRLNRVIASVINVALTRMEIRSEWTQSARKRCSHSRSSETSKIALHVSPAENVSNASDAGCNENRSSMNVSQSMSPLPISPNARSKSSYCDA